MIPLRDANPTRRTPLVTLSLVIACFVAFAWELGLLASGGEAALEAFITTWGVVPADLIAAWARGDYLSQETATLVTSQFLHGSWFHLLGNMLYLWIFGNNVEDRFGRLGFLGFYLLGGALAGLTQVAIDPTSTVPTIGASGAIAATLGAYFVLFPRARVTSLVFLGFFYQLIDVPAVIVLGFWFVLQLIDGLTSLGVDPDGWRAWRSSPTSAGSWSARVHGPAVVGRGRARLRRTGDPAGRGIIRPMDDGLVEMVVESVRVHMLSSRHVVILKEAARDRYLPIWIGPWEASAIAMKLQGLTPERPLTHDLFATTLEELGARIDRVVISELADETFHARILPRARRPDRSRWTRDRPTRSPSPSGPASGSSRPTRSSTRRRSAATAGSATTRGRRGLDARGDRREHRRPAAGRLPRLRQLARRGRRGREPVELGRRR